EKAGEVSSEELSFGSNIRGSKEYRKDMAKALVVRMYNSIGGEAILSFIFLGRTSFTNSFSSVWNPPILPAK
ncbi:hypothetical protein ACTPEM_22770, partial [Clostridioides difficile]